MIVKHLYLIAVAAILGCAPASSTSGASGTSRVPRRANVLTAEEMVAAHADITNAYDAVARLRPNWLAAHGNMGYATVFVDGQQHGDLNSLRYLQAYHVADIRYYDITEAGAKFGTQAGTGGAIDVRTKVR